MLQDFHEAVKWYRLAAAQGNEFAQINLGVMYTNGRGVRQDFVRAYMWFTLAAAALSGDSGDTAIKNRDRIASKMTAEQIATAQEMARRCQESSLRTATEAHVLKEAGTYGQPPYRDKVGYTTGQVVPIGALGVVT